MLCDTHGQHPLQLPAYYKCITTLFANHDKQAFIVDRIFNSLLALLFYNKNKKNDFSQKLKCHNPDVFDIKPALAHFGMPFPSGHVKFESIS